MAAPKPTLAEQLASRFTEEELLQILEVAHDAIDKDITYVELDVLDMEHDEVVALWEKFHGFMENR